MIDDEDEDFAVRNKGYQKDINESLEIFDQAYMKFVKH